jgi:hypothetical protein
MDNAEYIRRSPDNRRLKVVKKADGRVYFTRNKQSIIKREYKPGYTTWKDIIDIIREMDALSGENFNHDEATALLRGAGIIDESGELAVPYR